MSHNDVPGANPANNDQLKMGCWSEHEDGSLIFVESTEGGRVVYSIFDLKQQLEYRDAMPEVSFKRTFSWDAKDPKSVKWTWHDKTPFPWDRVIKGGFPDGQRFSSAESLISAAQRVAESLHLRGQRISRDFSHLSEETRGRVNTLWDKLGRAINELRK